MEDSPMDVRDAIRFRKSVRSYLPKAVEQEKILRIHQAGRLASSVRHLQEWRYIVVDNKEMINKITEKATSGQRFVAGAPLSIIICAETDHEVMRCGHLRFTVDCSISVGHMMLNAVEEGLGTCWIGGFHQEPVKELLDIPEEIEVFALLPVGYAADPSTTEKRRKSREELVIYGSWKQ